MKRIGESVSDFIANLHQQPVDKNGQISQEHLDSMLSPGDDHNSN